LICLFTLLIYANIITGDFVNLDDYSVILTGPEYQDIWSSIKSLDGYRITMTIMVKLFGINSSVSSYSLNRNAYDKLEFLVFILLLYFVRKTSIPHGNFYVFISSGKYGSNKLACGLSLRRESSFN